MRKSVYVLFGALLLIMSSWSKAQAQTITSAVLANYPDSICTAPQFIVTTSAYTGTLTLLAEFGDGTSGSTTLYSNSTGGTGYFYHSYTAGGTYTTKFVLVNGSTRVDSTVITEQYLYCNTFYIKAFNDLNNNCVLTALRSHLPQ